MSDNMTRPGHQPEAEKLPRSPQSSVLSPPSWAPQFEQWLEQTLAEKQVPGASVALAQDGRLVYARGFGLRDREQGLPATQQTIYGTGSVTKSFTALAIMQLAEAGGLSVDDPIVRHLPELAFSGGQPVEAITIHHLLTHTAGLPPLPTRHYAALAEMELEPFEREHIDTLLAGLPPLGPVRTYDNLIAFLGQHRFVVHGAPGERLSYSNEGYAMLGAIVERVSGRRYEEYVTEAILHPTGMARSVFGLTPLRTLDDVTAVYTRHNGETVHSPGWFHAPAIVPTGQLRSTAIDLVRYLEMVRNGGSAGGRQILSPAGIARMTTGQAPIARTRMYGYGWVVVEDYHGVRVVEHGGGHKGVAAHVGFIPERGLSCAVLTNVDGAPARTIWSHCAGAALGLPLDPPRQDLPSIDLTAEQLGSLAGLYRSEEGGSLRVILEAGRLFVGSEGERVPARPVAEDVLVFDEEGDERELRFLRGANGRPSHVFMGLRLLPRTGD